MRCEQHDLAAGPDGRCALCRRSKPPDPEASRSTRVVFVALGVAAVVLVSVGFTYRAFRDRAIVAESDRAIASATATARTIPAATKPTSTRDLDKDLDEERKRQALRAAGTAAPAAPAPPAPADTSAATDKKRDALASVRVVVYTTAWCPHCKRAKSWMLSNGIRFEERDIDLSPEYARQLKALTGKGSIPTFDVEGQISVGFSEQQVLAMRESAAARKTAP